jgi:hypothetical protein
VRLRGSTSAKRMSRDTRGGRGKSAAAKVVVGLTDQTFTCKTHSGAPRLSGAALAAMHEVLTFERLQAT